MTKNHVLKRTIAGMLALMVVAGTAPAGVNWTELVGGQSLVANADTVLSNSSNVWDADSTIEDNVTINGDVAVATNLTLTIPENVTLTVNGTINAEGKTLTVAGKGTLIVNGRDGMDGMDGKDGAHGYNGGGNGGNGGNGMPGDNGFIGNLIVDGATVEVNGGNGGDGGDGGNGGHNMGSEEAPGSGGDGGKGGNGGNGGRGSFGVDGNVTVKSGSATISGGTGGTGGKGGKGGFGDTCDGSPGNSGDVGDEGIAVNGTLDGDTIEESSNGEGWKDVDKDSSEARFIRITGAAAQETPQEQFETIDTSTGTNRTDQTYNGTNCSVTAYYYVRNTDGSNGVCIGEWADSSGNKQRTITISASSGYKITKVEGTINWKNPNLTIGDLKTTAGTLSSDNFNAGGTLTVDNIEGNVSEIVLSDNVVEGILFKSFKVYYAEAAQNKTDISKANVIVSAENKNVTVRLDGGLIDEKNYDVSYTGVTFKGESYSSPEFPTEPGIYKAKVTGKDDFAGDAESDEFTIPYTKYSNGITESVILKNPGDTVDMKDTTEEVGFNNKITVDFRDGDIIEHDVGHWLNYVASIYVDPDNKYIGCIKDTVGIIEVEFLLKEGKVLKVRYDPTGDSWYIAQVNANGKLSFDDATVTVDPEEQTVTVKINDEEVPEDNYELEFEGVDNNYKGKDFPTDPGEYNVKAKAKADSEIYDDETENTTFTIKADLENSEIAVDTKNQTVSVTLGDKPVSDKEYTLEFEGTDNNYKGSEFPTAHGAYKVTVKSKADSENYKGEKTSGQFTIDVSAPMWKWSEDYTSATATFEGAYGEPPVTLEATVTYSIPVKPTCTELGKELYLGTVKYLGRTYTSHNWFMLNPTGHSYGEPEWTWTDDNTATAAFTCENCGDKQTVTATITSKVIKPTYNNEGKTVYTATATFDGKTYTDTNEVKIDKLPYTAPTITYKKSDNAVKLNWTAVDGAEKYGIVGYANGEWKFLGKSADTSYILSGLKMGEKYKVAVVAKMGGEWVEDFSNAITVTPKAPVSAYPTVTNIEYSEKYHQFKLDWNAVDGAEKYGIAVLLAGRWKVVTQDISANTTTYTSPKLNELKTYKMVICAKIGGKWDTSNLNSRAFSVTVK